MKRQHGGSVYRHVAFNAALFRKSLHSLIRSPNGDVLLALNKHGTICGMLMAWHESMTWTHNKVATDLHFMAEQGGDMLLRAFKRWALEKGCIEICMGTFNRQDEDRIERLYNRIGFETIGRTYRMELVKCL